MSSKKPKNDNLSHTFREFLRALALSMISAKFKDSSMADAKKELLKNLDVSASALEAMLYRGSGGMDTWVQLFGALTEMNPEQLWESTLNPEVRTLLQVTVNDAISADEIFSILMGEQVEPRRKFIEDNALLVSNLDV